MVAPSALKLIPLYSLGNAINPPNILGFTLGRSGLDCLLIACNRIAYKLEENCSVFLIGLNKY